MGVKNKRGKNWDVKGGKLVIETPAVAATSEELPVARLDKEITRAERRKTRAEADLATAQTAFDEATAYEAELKALRADLPE
jgi:hypothetical protein